MVGISPGKWIIHFVPGNHTMSSECLTEERKDCLEPLDEVGSIWV